ncbi:hypothetical protein [Paenarthrobacter nitroguajacolicus]|uniref:hypothetical protein n=1 Tax=Paenarthrobacter nitroguajacolicus TaxID=211146 RepID=UPI000B223E43|nr:hypothetical protein [Paenarthrobacter nitroguajacolicus]
MTSRCDAENVQAATFLRGVDGVRETLARWIRGRAGEDPVEMLYASMVEAHSNVANLASVYATYLGAIAEPQLRPVALIASVAASDAIAEAVGPDLAVIISAYMDGVFIRWIVEGVSPDTPIPPEIKNGLTALVRLSDRV